jgi:hypothetical protein
MRSAKTSWFWALILVLSATTGCEMPGLSMEPGGGSPDLTEAQPLDDPAAALAAQAQAQAQRIAQVSDQQQPQPPREILWRNLAMEPQANTPIAPEQSATQAKPIPQVVQPIAAAVEPTVTAVADTQTQPGPTATNHAQARLTQTQAYNQLLQAVRSSDDSNLSRAITAATLGTVGPHGELDWSLLSSLSPQDQQRVQRYHRAIAVLRKQALTGDGPIDQATLAGGLEEVFGSQPIAIRSIELCEKVLGYGVYDTFPDRTFPAGRDQKMIVYVELDHFKSAPRGEGDGYEVRLRQELELYESNGFEVWSHEPVQIIDTSKNQRRDFFVVQLVTLPGQLALGQYHLKIRIYDENAGTRDEASIPIKIVADSSLVKQTGR